MPRVTEQLLRKRSEHNDGVLSTLEEVDLHQERLTRLGPRLRRACPRLQHLSLSGNALGRLAGAEARGLRSLRTLNLALNCLRRLPPARVMRGLESLERLDLTANFLDASALFALGVSGLSGVGGGEGGEGGGALAQLPRLAELWLMGNPCVEALNRAAAGGVTATAAVVVEEEEGGVQAKGASAAAADAASSAAAPPAAPPLDADDNAYRAYVLLALSRLERLDGKPATASARLAARRASGALKRALRRAAAAELGLELQEGGGGSGEAAASATEAAVAALEASVLRGEEHPETLALYGPPEAAGDDETSESESDEDGDNDDKSTRPRRRRPRVQETGTLDPSTGEVRRPWCPATRLLDLRDQRRQRGEGGTKGGGGGAAANNNNKPPSSSSSSAPAPAPDPSPLFSSDPLGRRQPRRQALPPVPDQDPGTGETLPLRNEGRWRFSLDVVPGSGSCGSVSFASSAAGKPPLSSSPSHPSHDDELELDVDVGRHLDTSHMQLEVLPRAVRLLVRGRLLQLRLPAEVRADACAARRSRATGRLCVRMPLLLSGGELDDPTLVHPRSVWGESEKGEDESGGGTKKKKDARAGETVAAAVVVAAAGARSGEDGEKDYDDETPPPL